MKLRIKGDSLRLRLAQGEMRELQTRGEVEDRVSFGAGAALRYRLRRRDDISAISASYRDNLIEISLPGALAERWCGTDLVSLSATQALGAGELRILLEKDWACLAPREGEDESDHFPHPRTAGGTKAC